MFYVLQVTIYSALFYAVYLLALKNRAPHDRNRAYLLLCALLPLVLPFIKIPALSTSIPVSTGTLNMLLPEITVLTKEHIAVNSVYSRGNIFIAIYLLGILVMLFRSTIQYIGFRRFVRHGEYKVIDNAKVLLNTKTGPGSFQNYVFLPDNNIDQSILEHELAHVRLKHSNDILLLRLLQAIFWPNIMLYIISRELKIVHEFQADACAVHSKQDYIATLLNDTFSTNRFTLSHTFFYHPLKRRIMMLQKSPLSRTKLRITMLKTGFSAVLLLAGIIYLQSCKQQPDNLKKSAGIQKNIADSVGVEFQADTVNDTTNFQKNFDGIAYVFAGKSPRIPYDLSEYLSTHIKYPEEARKKGIAGRVVVKFVVNEDGAVVNPVIIRDVDPSLDAEALRVVSQMPKWIPGEKDGKKVPVYITLPISFQLD